MKQPNPIKNPFFYNNVLHPRWMGSSGTNKLKEFHEWLGRVIAWREEQRARDSDNAK